MIRTLCFVGLLCAVCAACSSSSDASGSEANAGSNGNAVCPDISGAWVITEHCQTEFVGMTLQVTENACALSFAAPFDGFTGNVTTDDKITLSGPQSCTGTATGSAVSMTCTGAPGSCAVKLARQAP